MHGVRLRAQSGAEGSSGAGASPSSSRGSGGGSSAQPFGAVGSSLANFGKQLISGTKEVFDTVSERVKAGTVPAGAAWSTPL
jgi:hypothetical protein